MYLVKIIQHYLKYRPKVDWIKASSGLCCLKLDMTVPVDDIVNEWSTVSDLAILHRANESMSEKFFYGHKGWKSLTIFGAGHDVTEDSNDLKDWTIVADRCPKTKRWLEQNFVINELTGRIRFMLLEPGGYILPHVDRPNKGLHEVNIAITNPQGCIFRFTEHGDVPFTPGSAFLMDISNQHLVFNDSNSPRLHIIVHSQPKNAETILNSYENRYNS